MLKKFIMLSLLILFAATSVATAATAPAPKEDFKNRTANLAEFHAIRVGYGSGTIRIVLDLTRKVSYKESYVENPSRMIIDLQDTWINPKVQREIELKSTAAKKIRIAQFNPTTVRIVIETMAETKPFFLEGGKSGVRLVIDVGNSEFKENPELTAEAERQRALQEQREREAQAQRERELQQQRERELQQQREQQERELQRQRERELQQREQEINDQRERELRERELELERRERELKEREEREVQAQREHELEKRERELQERERELQDRERERLEKEQREKEKREQALKEKEEKERIEREIKEQRQREKELKEKEKREKKERERLEKEKREQEKRDKKNKDKDKDKKDEEKKEEVDQPFTELDNDLSMMTALKGKKIVIDPGHGGNDAGAIGPTGVMEKNVTLKVALELKKLLEAEGAQVIMTRDGDTTVSPKGAKASDIEELGARCDVANRNGADIFISIHADSFTRPEARGTTGYYYSKGSGRGQKLADCIRRNLVEQLGTPSRGTQPCNFYVVKNTDMPATLIELGFISNKEEEKLLDSKEGVQRAAQGILDGIEDYFG